MSRLGAARTTHRFRSLLGALLLYAALVGGLTWPLLPHLADRLPDTARACRFDSRLVTWALVHQSRAVWEDPSAYFEAGIYHPTPRALLYGEAAFGALPYFLPIFAVSQNPTLAINVTFLAAVTLTAWALHCVLVLWTGSFWAAFVGAWTFLMTRWVLWTWVPCAPNYAILPYFPFLILLAERPLRGMRDSLRLGLLLFVQGLTSVYVAAAALAPLGLLGVGRWIAQRHQRGGAWLFATVLAAAFALAGVYGTYLFVALDNPALSQQSVWALATPVTRLPWAFFERSRPTALPVAALALLALGTALYIRGGRAAAPPERRRAWGHAAFWFVVGILASLEPAVHWGDRVIWLPQQLLAWTTPLYEVIRLPYRLGIGALIGGCLLVGLAFAEIIRRIPLQESGRRVAAAVLGIVVLLAAHAEYDRGAGAPPVRRLAPLPRSYPLQKPADGSSPLVALAQKIDGPLLELPIPRSNRDQPTAPSQARAMYRAIFHRRPILNGYSGYWPSGFPARVALARRLPDPAALEALGRETGLRLILLRAASLSAAERARWAPILEAGGNTRLRRLGVDDNGDVLFAVLSSAKTPGD